jgi:hypothetical protein
VLHGFRGGGEKKERKKKNPHTHTHTLRFLKNISHVCDNVTVMPNALRGIIKKTSCTNKPKLLSIKLIKKINNILVPYTAVEEHQVQLFVVLSPQPLQKVEQAEKRHSNSRL